MHSLARRFFVIIILVALAAIGRAGEVEALAIIDKAIKAHGITDKRDSHFAYRGKNKGTIHVNGMDLEFVQEVAVQVPGQFKEVIEMTVMNQKVTVITVYNGKQGWIKVNDKEIKVEKELLSEFQEMAHMIRLGQAMFLKEKGLKFSSLGEVQVNGKDAVGIKVEMEGKKDVNFYFDKATGLMAKTERRTRDFMTGQEVTEERIITKYQQIGERKLAKEVHVLRDGKKFLEAEVLESQLPARIDDTEFAPP